MKGYIPISRGLFEHPFWCEERCYSRFEAWVYLLQDARFEDTKLYLTNTVFVVRRGQISVSLRYLAEAWGWSTKKVKHFLELLQTDKMITFETPKETGQTLITISKYDTYNKLVDKEETPKETIRKQQGNSKETNINKDNKENKDKEKDLEPKGSLSDAPTQGDIGNTTTPELIEDPLKDQNLEKKESCAKENREYCQKVVDYFNKKCVSLPRVQILSNDRIETIMARTREHGKDMVRQAIDQASVSEFLAGQNKRGFCADLNWIFKPRNFIKVLEGNYGKKGGNDTTPPSKVRNYDE